MSPTFAYLVCDLIPPLPHPALRRLILKLGASFFLFGLINNGTSRSNLTLTQL